jgi:osmotically-inducible protein OsmY
MTASLVPVAPPPERHRDTGPWLNGSGAGVPAEAADDRRLREHIERALLATGHRSLAAVSVAVRDRWVTLRGQLPRYYLRQLALTAVLTAPAVRGLRDEVTVAPPD